MPHNPRLLKLAPAKWIANIITRAEVESNGSLGSHWIPDDNAKASAADNWCTHFLPTGSWMAKYIRFRITYQLCLCSKIYLNHLCPMLSSGLVMKVCYTSGSLDTQRIIIWPKQNNARHVKFIFIFYSIIAYSLLFRNFPLVCRTCHCNMM